MGAGEPAEDTREKIMTATYRALSTHGYSNLTMQAIADEFDKTKGVLHYHYDTKQELLVAFLEYLLDAFNENAEIDSAGTPAQRLETLIDALLLGQREPNHTRKFDHWELTAVLLDIRAQAPHDGDFSRQLTHNFGTIETLLADIIRDGIASGAFRDVDPERTATLLLACINGARIYHVTLDREDVGPAVRETLGTVVEEWLYRPDE